MKLTDLLATPLIVIIQIYKYALSPWLGTRCRFSPSCSAYALESLKKYGIVTGSILAAKRVGRCHPWHPGGYDPVP